MNIIVEKLHTSVDDEGSGDVIVMLHGWGSDRSTFALLAGQLSGNYRVIRIDLPGFGGTQAPTEPWGIEEYCHFVAAVLKKRQVEKIHTVIGHSMGGRIALQAFGRGVLFAPHLVLIASHGIKESAQLRNQAYKAVAKTGKIATKVLPSSMQRRLRSKLYEQAGATDYLHAGNMKESFKKIINTDAQADAAAITSDTLLIYGEQDTQTPPAFGERFNQLITRSRLEVVSDAGHFVHIDKPTHVLTLVKDFLV
jgi:pimeloyl-ACP methyl ester carboxylesterase